MPRVRKIIETDHPFGLKLNAVMADMGMAGDYKRLAEDFGVTVASAREWITLGRFAKDRYADLVRWSNRSLDWWFDIPPLAGATVALANERAATYRIAPPWPFRTVSVAQFEALDAWSRAEVEGFIKGLARGVQGRSSAA